LNTYDDGEFNKKSREVDLLPPDQMKLELKIKINSEYSRIASKIPLSDGEYERLKESINQNGLLDTIKINEEVEILDGHHRAKICQELGIEPKTTKLKFDSKELEKLFVININAEGYSYLQQPFYNLLINTDRTDAPRRCQFWWAVARSRPTSFYSNTIL